MNRGDESECVCLLEQAGATRRKRAGLELPRSLDQPFSWLIQDEGFFEKNLLKLDPRVTSVSATQIS